MVFFIQTVFHSSLIHDFFRVIIIIFVRLLNEISHWIMFDLPDILLLIIALDTIPIIVLDFVVMVVTIVIRILNPAILVLCLILYSCWG